MTDITTVRLEKHPTKSTGNSHVNGSLTVVWRDWDKLIKHEPKMVYVSSVNRGEIKGPHLHTKRNSYFVCIHGKVVFVIRDEQGKFHEVVADENEPILIHVPSNVASAHMNLAKETSRILTLADISWRPNDNEMKDIAFDGYDWSKWNY